jgi:hypothetical protein
MHSFTSIILLIPRLQEGSYEKKSLYVFVSRSKVEGQESKLWPKVFGVEESESSSHFSRFMTPKMWLEEDYFKKIAISYKIWSKIFGAEESESPSHFSRFMARRISPEERYFNEITVVYNILKLEYRYSSKERNRIQLGFCF